MIGHYRYLAIQALKIAKGNAPVDSGNLRHNAIFLKDFHLTKDGFEFRINYSSRNANYIDPVNFGWTSPSGVFVTGKHFIEKATIDIAQYIRGTLTNKRLNTLRNRVEETENLSPGRRKLIYHRSVELTEQGQVTPGTETINWRLKI